MKMRSVTGRKLTVIIVLLAICGMSLGAEENSRILILNSYHPGFLWSDSIMEGIKATLHDRLHYPEITLEYMDTKRHFYGMKSDLMQNYRAIYRIKYSEKQFDVLIVSDDNAYQFVLEYGRELFGNTPVVFCGVNNFDRKQLEGRANITGIAEIVDDKGTIELILELHPEVERIGFITDWTTSGRGNRERLSEIAEEMSGKADFFFLDPGGGISVEELKRKVAKLGPETAIHYRDFFRDKNNTYLPPEIFVPELTALANVPIYSIGSFYLGLGMVGGKMESAREQGKVAADMAASVIQGARPSEIPIIDKPIGKYMFDYEALQRFSIDLEELPPGSIVVNRPFSFYREYTGLFWGSLAVFTVFLLLIAFLITVLSKSRAVNKKLRETVGKLGTTLNSIGDAVITTDIRGIITSVNPAAETLLGLRQENLIGQSLDSATRITTAPEQNDYIEGTTFLETRDGREIPISSSSAPIQDDENNIFGTITVLRDKSAEYESQKNMEESLKEKTILVREIHHRVKNNLNIIASLLNLQSHQSEEIDDPKAVLVNCKNRIHSMALIHEHLYMSDSLAAISMDEYIEEMVHNLFDLYGRDGRITYDMQLDPVSMHIDAAVPLGLLLNELITNAFVHAFPDNRKGAIRIELRDSDKKECLITVADTGVGFTERREERSTLGLELVQVLSEQLKASVERTHRQGTEYRIRIPLMR